MQLFTIDPQNSFCDPDKGELYVDGAADDMVLLTEFVTKYYKKLNDIHVTMDSHRTIDVGHPCFWINSEGEHPTPIAVLSNDDIQNDVWFPVNPGWKQKMKDYSASLAANNRYPLCVWPEHCIIGTHGHCIVPSFSEAIRQWERERVAQVNYVTKGSNPFTEHYSAVKADVPDPQDPTTQLNTGLIDILQTADTVFITGQALSHCVANTVTDIADNFGQENIKKLVLLTDTTSSVPGFESLGEEFIKNMTARGMKTSTTKDVLA